MTVTTETTLIVGTGTRSSPELFTHETTYLNTINILQLHTIIYLFRSCNVTNSRHLRSAYCVRALSIFSDKCSADVQSTRSAYLILGCNKFFKFVLLGRTDVLGLLCIARSGQEYIIIVSIQNIIFLN